MGEDNSILMLLKPYLSPLDQTESYTGRWMKCQFKAHPLYTIRNDRTDTNVFWQESILFPNSNQMLQIGRSESGFRLRI